MEVRRENWVGKERKFVVRTNFTKEKNPITDNKQKNQRKSTRKVFSKPTRKIIRQKLNPLRKTKVEKKKYEMHNAEGFSMNEKIQEETNKAVHRVQMHLMLVKQIIGKLHQRVTSTQTRVGYMYVEKTKLTNDQVSASIRSCQRLWNLHKKAYVVNLLHLYETIMCKKKKNKLDYFK